jgi:hypothetical protein
VMTVGVDRAVVESRLSAGQVRCPACGGVLGRWGWARPRRVRSVAGDVSAGVRLRPRRGRCRSCGKTQVLLPSGFVSRRADSGSVIAAGLAVVAGGGTRAEAVAATGRPESTVRGWFRAAGRVADRASAGFAQVVAAVAPDAAAVAPLWEGASRRGRSSGSAGVFVSACSGLAAALSRRWRQGPVGWLEAAAAVCRCEVLCVGWWDQHEPALAAGAVARALSGCGP